VPSLLSIDQFMELSASLYIESVPDFEEINAYMTPESAIFKTIFANNLTTEFSGKRCLFRPLEWGVWPSAEVPGLYAAIGAAHGIDRQVYSEMVDDIAPGESEYLAQVVAVSMYMCYEFVLAIPELATSIFYSHDDYVYGWPVNSRGDEFVKKFCEKAKLGRFVGFREVED
jgi:hypothetical protein